MASKADMQAALRWLAHEAKRGTDDAVLLARGLGYGRTMAHLKRAERHLVAALDHLSRGE